MRSLRCPSCPDGEAARSRAGNRVPCSSMVPQRSHPSAMSPLARRVLVTKGMEPRAQILAGIRAAREAIARHDALVTFILGGDQLACRPRPATETTLAVAPHRHLAPQYPALWRPPHIIGTGDAEVMEELAVSPSRLTLA